MLEHDSQRHHQRHQRRGRRAHLPRQGLDQISPASIASQDGRRAFSASRARRSPGSPAGAHRRTPAAQPALPRRPRRTRPPGTRPRIDHHVDLHPRRPPPHRPRGHFTASDARRTGTPSPPRQPPPTAGKLSLDAGHRSDTRTRPRPTASGVRWIGLDSLRARPRYLPVYLRLTGGTDPPSAPQLKRACWRPLIDQVATAALASAPTWSTPGQTSCGTPADHVGRRDVGQPGPTATRWPGRPSAAGLVGALLRSTAPASTSSRRLALDSLPCTKPPQPHRISH